jgi:hypothetical protein
VPAFSEPTMKTEHTIEDLAADLKATRDTLETLIVWLAIELGEKAVDKLLSKLSGEAGGDGQNVQAKPCRAAD